MKWNRIRVFTRCHVQTIPISIPISCRRKPNPTPFHTVLISQRFRANAEFKPKSAESKSKISREEFEELTVEVGILKN